MGLLQSNTRINHRFTRTTKQFSIDRHLSLKSIAAHPKDQTGSIHFLSKIY